MIFQILAFLTGATNIYLGVHDIEHSKDGIVTGIIELLCGSLIFCGVLVEDNMIIIGVVCFSVLLVAGITKLYKR